MSPDDLRPRLNKLAIAAGAIVDLAGSLVTVVLVIFAAMVVAGAQGHSLQDNIVEEWSDDTAYLITLLVVGGLWVVAGGFTAGKVARRDHVRHAAWTGVLTFAIGTLFVLLPSPDGPQPPWWYDAVGLLLTVPSAIAGGYLALPRRDQAGDSLL